MQKLKTLLRILVWLLVIAGIGLLVLYLFQSVLMYPGKNLGGSSTEWTSRLNLVGSRGFILVSIPGSKPGTEIKALWAPNSQGTCPAVLWFHGRDEDVTDLATVMGALRDQGVHVLAVEYPGYGDSKDALDEASLLDRADAAFEYLAKREEVMPRSILAGGYELGAAIALQVAARKRASGVLALGTLPDMETAVAARIKGLKVGFILHDHFEVAHTIADVPVPILFVHGSADAVVPLARIEALQALARRSRLVTIEGAGGPDLVGKIPREQWDAIGQFLANPR